MASSATASPRAGGARRFPFWSSPHTGASAGTARLVPTSALFATRLLSALFLLGSLIGAAAEQRFGLQFLTNWTFALLTLSFFVLAALSLLVLLRRIRAADALAAVAVPLHFLASAGSLYVVPVYFAFLGRPPFDFLNLVVHGLQLIPIALDIALGARYAYGFGLILVSVAYFLVYVAFVWVRYAVWRNDPGYSWPYSFLDYEKQTPGVTAGYYAGFIAWAVVASLIIIGLKRLYEFVLGRCTQGRDVSSDVPQEENCV